MRGPAWSANGDDTATGGLALLAQASGETPMIQRCAQTRNTTYTARPPISAIASFAEVAGDRKSVV